MATSANETRVPILPSEHSKSLMQNNAPPSGVKVGELSNTAAVVTSLVAGAVAGAIAKTVIAPLDRTKINFQISNTAYSWRAALAFLRESARRSGASALWRGNSATLARIAPYAAIQFSAHEQYKRALRVHEPEAAKEHRSRLFLAGSLAGVTAQSVTYPLDLARARMAVSRCSRSRSLAAVFVRVVRDEGALTLYRGYTATVLGVIPYAGVSFFTYDSLKHAYLEDDVCRARRREAGQPGEPGVRQRRGRPRPDGVLSAGHRAAPHADGAAPRRRLLPAPHHRRHPRPRLQDGRRSRILQRPEHELGERPSGGRYILRYLRRHQVLATGHGGRTALVTLACTRYVVGMTGSMTFVSFDSPHYFPYYSTSVWQGFEKYRSYAHGWISVSYVPSCDMLVIAH